MDNVILATGIGLGIIGAITKRTSVIAVGLALLGVRAYLRYREVKVGIEAGTIKTHMTKEQAAETNADLNEDADRILAAIAEWERAHPGRTGYYDPDKGIVVDSEAAANEAVVTAQAQALISRSLVLR